MKINGLQWKIEIVPENDERMNADGTYMGLCSFLEQTIFLRAGMSKKLTERTFIHELVHAFIFSYGLDSDMSEEDICNFFASHYDEFQKIISEVKNGTLHR